MAPLLSTQNLSKEFAGGMLRPGKTVRALDKVSLSIEAGVRVAIVGGSGSGKSTLAACLACLEEPTSGEIYFEGRGIRGLSQRELRMIRPQIQLVFQDSGTAFNPDFSVLQVLEEPLLLNTGLNRMERQASASALLEKVGLQEKLLARKTGELSGGQRQRVAIARSLSVEPKVLILDEALSALDSSVQAQIANLLLDLTDPPGAGTGKPAVVLITHDLVMAARIADEIIVMQDGRIVERGLPREILSSPSEEATKALISATPAATFSGSQRPIV